MRSLFAGMIMLSASMAVVGTAQAQVHHQRPPGYGSMQAPIGHRQPTQADLQPTQNDLENIAKDNQQLDMQASQDEITGAGQARSGEDALTKRIGQDNSRLDRQIREICPSCGGAEVAPPVHRRAWPVHNGFNHQPSQDELRALHQQDVTSDQAHEIDRLYDQLMSTSNRITQATSRRGAPTALVCRARGARAPASKSGDQRHGSA